MPPSAQELLPLTPAVFQILLALVDELMDEGQVTPARFAVVTGLPLGRPQDALDPYAEKLAAFRLEGPERLRA